MSYVPQITDCGMQSRPSAVLVPTSRFWPTFNAMLAISGRLTCIMTPRNDCNHGACNQVLAVARFMNVSKLGLIPLALVASLATAGLAQANSISACAGEWSSSVSAICNSADMVNRISGIEGVEMNFYGSEFASDDQIAFKTVSYYSSYTPHAKSSSNDSQNSAPSGDGTPAGNDLTDFTGTVIGPGPVTVDTPLQVQAVKSDLTSTRDAIPGDLNSVPEPRYAGIVLLLAGFAVALTVRQLRVHTH